MNVDYLKIREKTKVVSLINFQEDVEQPSHLFLSKCLDCIFCRHIYFEFLDDGEPRNSGQEIKVSSGRQTEPNSRLGFDSDKC